MQQESFEVIFRYHDDHCDHDQDGEEEIGQLLAGLGGEAGVELDIGRSHSLCLANSHRIL